jgi:isopentenyl-diphosphate delta-isomerase type 1
MTTDSQDELFDLVNEADEVIGKAKRGEVHGNPALIHRSVAVAVFNSLGELFLHQRSKTKDTDPLYWTISCSGHVASGQTPDEAAVRELFEELGIKGTHLTFVTKFIYRSKIETEFASLYKTVWDGKMSLHPQEIAQGRFFSKKNLQEFLDKEKIILNDYGRISLGKLGWAF